MFESLIEGAIERYISNQFSNFCPREIYNALTHNRDILGSAKKDTSFSNTLSWVHSLVQGHEELAKEMADKFDARRVLLILAKEHPALCKVILDRKSGQGTVWLAKQIDNIKNDIFK